MGFIKKLFGISDEETVQEESEKKPQESKNKKEESEDAAPSERKIKYSYPENIAVILKINTLYSSFDFNGKQIKKRTAATRTRTKACEQQYPLGILVNKTGHAKWRKIDDAYIIHFDNKRFYDNMNEFLEKKGLNIDLKWVADKAMLYESYKNDPKLRIGGRKIKKSGDKLDIQGTAKEKKAIIRLNESRANKKKMDSALKNFSKILEEKYGSHYSRDRPSIGIKYPIRPIQRDYKKDQSYFDLWYSNQSKIFFEELKSGLAPDWDTVVIEKLIDISKGIQYETIPQIVGAFEEALRSSIKDCTGHICPECRRGTKDHLKEKCLEQSWKHQTKDGKRDLRYDEFEENEMTTVWWYKVKCRHCENTFSHTIKNVI